MIIVKKMREILFLRKNAYICNTEKPIKLTIMREKSKKKKNYRITIIFRDQIMTERFYREDIAIRTVTNMKELFPGIFVSGAVEEKKGIWKVVWTLVNEKKQYVKTSKISTD